MTDPPAPGPGRPGKTHLLMTADAVGGVWTYALELAAGLAPRGFETTLAVLGPAPAADQRAAARAVPGLSLVETGLALDWMAKDPAEVTASGRALARLAREVGADLIHLNSPVLAAADAFRVPVVGGCHSCVATWWSAVKTGEPPADFRWRTELLAKGYEACDLLIAPTRAFAEATWKTYGVRPKTVWNGRTAPGGPRCGAREPVAIAAGRLWDAGKGLAVLEAAAGLARTPIEAAGPVQGPHGERVVLNKVRVLGRLTPEAMADRLGRARVFVAPALYEPFGLSVLEAAQAGCALLLSDIPSFRELWDGAAVFTPPRDPKALARALDELAADEAACARLAAAASLRARAYRPEVMAAATAAAYASMTGGATPGRAVEAVA